LSELTRFCIDVGVLTVVMALGAWITYRRLRPQSSAQRIAALGYLGAVYIAFVDAKLAQFLWQLPLYGWACVFVGLAIVGMLLVRNWHVDGAPNPSLNADVPRAGLRPRSGWRQLARHVRAQSRHLERFCARIRE